jgi:hypothetical protein
MKFANAMDSGSPTNTPDHDRQGFAQNHALNLLCVCP